MSFLSLSLLAQEEASVRKSLCESSRLLSGPQVLSKEKNKRQYEDTWLLRIRNAGAHMKKFMTSQNISYFDTAFKTGIGI